MQGSLLETRIALAHALFRLEHCPLLSEIPCYFGDGYTYAGIVDQTESGSKCDSWGNPTSRTDPWTNSSGFPESSMAAVKNYCRNPDGSARPWCYSTNVNHRWEHCPVPKCGKCGPNFK